MSNGAVVVAPIAIVALAPLALAAVGVTAVVAAGAGVARAVEALALAHAESRLRGSQSRYSDLSARARKLRVSHNELSASHSPGVSGTNAQAADLDRLCDELESLLNPIQAEFDRLSLRLAESRGRHTELVDWAGEAGLSDAASFELPKFIDCDAVEELSRQVAAVASDTERLSGELRRLWGERAGNQAASVWKSIRLPSISSLDRDPLASAERWRQPLRERLSRAISQAHALPYLPEELAQAAEMIESGEEPAASAAVGRATNVVAAAIQRERTIKNFHASVATMSAEAADLANYVVAGHCDRALEEFAERCQKEDGPSLASWAQATQQSLSSELQLARDLAAKASQMEASQMRRLVNQFVYGELEKVFLSRGMIAIPMETGVPLEGHLFVDGVAANGRRPTHGSLVGLASDGSLKVWPVRLGERAATDEDVATDMAHCQRTNQDNTAEVLDQLEDLLRSASQLPLPPGPLISWDHQEFAQMFNLVLTSEQQKQLDSTFERRAHHSIAIEQQLPVSRSRG